jgi:hypothetical protein
VPHSGVIHPNRAARADTGSMRAAAALIFVLAGLGVLAGCSALSADSELRALVDAAAPPGAPLECEWGSSSYEGEPDAWVGCWSFLTEAPETVARSMTSQLEAHGFAVSSWAGDLTIELTGTRGADTLCVDLLSPGFTRGRNTSPSEVISSPGDVLVDIWTARLGEGTIDADACAPLPVWVEDL